MESSISRGRKVFKKEEMISVREFAQRLGVSRSFAYQLVEKGKDNGGILAFRYGIKRAMRVPVSEVERYKKECRVEEE